jgi:hypothetical protein
MNRSRQRPVLIAFLGPATPQHQTMSTNNDKLLYGIDVDLQKRIAARWSPENAKIALEWISKLSGMTLDADFHTALKDGVALCAAMNVLSPNSCKINKMKMPFMMRENIVQFLEACKKYGMKDTDLFVTQDLFEGDNLVSVLDCLFSLGGLAKAKGFAGVTIGVKQTQAQGESKFTVSSTGGSVPSRQTQGSYGYADTTQNRSLSHQIIKTTDTGSNAPTLLSKGSVAHDPNSNRMDKIIRSADEFRGQTGAAAGKK